MKNIKEYQAFILLPLALFYWGLVFWRNFFYKHNFFLKRKLPCKVISIGNITLGGTGKTPTVIYLCALLKNNNYKTAILSRGYQRKTKGTLLVSSGDGPLYSWQEVGDEPFMIATKLKGVPIVVDEDRFRGGMFLIKEYNPDIIILDDGFQHRSLYRDLDIVLLNGGDTQNTHKLLPYGYLREPWINIKRADAIFITKKHPQPFLKRKLLESKLPLFETKIKITISRSNKNNLDLPNNLLDAKVLLLSGIGDPTHFEQTALHLGCNVRGITNFPDHFIFTKNHILETEGKAKELKANYILTTEKDWIRIKELDPEFPFIVIDIGIRTVDEPRLINIINKKLYSISGPYPMQKQHQQM